MKLQACSQCGAQFDVSEFAPGQKFECGSCGAILVAHVAGGAPKKPAAPQKPGAPQKPAATQKPGASRRPGAPVGGRRGPQYRPPERHQEAQSSARKPARPAGAGRSSGRPAAKQGRSTREPAAKKQGLNPLVLYGLAGLVVVAVALFLILGSGDNTDGGGTSVASGNGSTGVQNPGVEPAAAAAAAAAAASPDTLADLKEEANSETLESAQDFASLAKRFLKLGGEPAKAEARTLYERLIREADPNYAPARKFLGYTDFQADILFEGDSPRHVLPEGGDPIPQAIHNRKGYAFLDAIVQFNGLRWLDDPAQIKLAKEAVAAMHTHEKRLKDDRSYRLGDIVRGNIAADAILGDLNYVMDWVAPYLVVYSSDEALSDFDLLKITDKKERKKQQAELAKKRDKWRKIVREKGMIFQETYKEWMRRYQDRFDLKPLDAPWGGRPDYKDNDRRFPEGVPLVIWIFTDGDAFRKFHLEKLGQVLPPGVAGYFTPATGWIFLFDEGGSGQDRVFEINKTVHEATHQLEYWFTRQKNKWKKPKPTQDPWSEGIAEFLGSVQMQPDRTLKFIEVNVPRLTFMKSTAKALKNMSGEDYTHYLIPINVLMGFGSYRACTNWVRSKWGTGAGQSLMYEQGWAFTYFLNHYKNGKYKESWLKYFDAVLKRQVSRQTMLPVFKRAFGIKYEDEWDELQSEWETYFKDVILPMSKDLSKWEYTPPSTDDDWLPEDKD